MRQDATELDWSEPVHSTVELILTKTPCLVMYLDFPAMPSTPSCLACAGSRSSAVIRLRFSPRQGFTEHVIQPFTFLNLY
ncbi:hypothetical protein HZ326_7797 [Fusarium oxysporum f. sp. albedinis]|nr:hypothetical protein HZ326_7797 [Fusarium oxysporum f. sp. albedinis]